MSRKETGMSEAELRLLLQSMEGQVTQGHQNAARVVNLLAQETIKFRDKLKENTGEILTVHDTRMALEALADHLNNQPLPLSLTPEQRALAQIWIDRLTIF